MFRLIKKNEWFFEQAPGFRGFNKLPLAHYGYEPADVGLRAAMRLPITQIRIVHEKNYLLVFLPPYHIGTYFANDARGVEYIKAFQKKKISAVHVRIEMQAVVGKNRLGDSVTEERPTPFLFVQVAP